jgi:glycerophosphoryl diester phosphodiesterase
MKVFLLILVIMHFLQTLPAQSGAPLPVHKSEFVVIAHRGNHVRVPENTIESVKDAIQAGADYVEIDLRTTKDGRLVIHHDASLERMTGKKAKISDLTMEEIKNLKIRGRTGSDHHIYRIPEFSEILKTCQGRINIYLDFKDADVAEAWRQIKKARMEKQVVVYLNKENQYSEWRKTAPQMPLMTSLPESIQTEDQLSAFLELMPLEVVDNIDTPELAAALKKRGIAIWLDVQDENEGPVSWNAALKKPVQGFQTDHPDALISFLHKQKRR